MAVPAGMISILCFKAIHALVYMASHALGTTIDDVPHGPNMGFWHLISVFSDVFRAMPTKYLRYLRHIL